ncbi:MAG: M56 family metallopeptidase [Clostridia bacterium]|nr:M56 family metallopeptidase [Clostridia bacterium]
MGNVFLDAINLSITASLIVLVVVLLRFVLKKAPKWINCILWAIVGLRLAIPFSFESILSLVPSKETISIPAYTTVPDINTGVQPVDNTVNEYINTYAHAHGTDFSDIQSILCILWLVGIGVMLAYSVISYIRLYKRVRVSLRLTDNIYHCDNIDSPFILGVIRPKIYLPAGIDTEQADYVISHEQAHIKRKDHWWKPLGFILLSVYWFNPVLWVAYVLFCRDIELACDEKAVKNMDNTYRKGYSLALVDCSVQRRTVIACPLAFGEVGVKDRIKSVLNYKKPALWVIIVAVVICIAVSVCFLTNPVEEDLIYTINDGYTTHNDIDVEITEISVGEEGSYIVMQWKNNSGKTIWYGEEFHLYRKVLGSVPVEVKSGNDYWNSIAYVVDDDFADRKIILTSYDLSEKGNYVLEFDFDLEDEAANYTAYLEFSASGEEDVDFAVVGGADGPENVTVDAVDALKAKYPDFFGLSTKGGLAVYVWQYSENDYSCGLVSGENHGASNKHWALVAASVEEMHIILSTYNIDPSEVLILPYANPASSYLYEIDDEYRKNIKALFPGYGILDEPPALSVLCGEYTVAGWQGSYQWTAINSDGTGQTTFADSSHPLDIVDSMTPLKLAETCLVELQFAVNPDKITVYRYDLSKGSSAKADQTETDGLTFEISSGFLYEIVAEWNSYTNYNGTARYAFITE